MSNAAVGTGSLTWGGFTNMKFFSPDGFTIIDVDAGVADCTPDDAASKEWAPGDKPNYGQATGTLIVLTEEWAEIKAAIDARTIALATYTGPLQTSTNGTNGTVSGQAFIATVSITSEENGIVKAPVSLQWQSAPAIANETA